MIRNARFRALVLLLLVALSASPAVAAGPAPAKPKTPAFVTWLLQELDRLVPGILAKGRDGMDPNGAPAPTSGAPTADSDGRDGMDPDGHA